MYVAIEGCSHGELDVIYSTLLHAQKKADLKLDLLICCGDFQSVRNPTDLKCMAVPTKYMQMQSFYKYYSGEKVAPVLTIFIGGNHEASNFLQELPYGGWVAPNIYYLGYGGVVNVGGLRIGGISGIYKGHDYLKGRFERPPYSDSTIRSVYHVRNLEVFRMKQLAQDTPLDIFLSHDWPRGVTKYGDADKLCQQKQFFKEEVESDSLGSRAAHELLHSLKPKYWFAGHLHVKFAALVGHEADTETLGNSDFNNKPEENKDDANIKQKEEPKNLVCFTRFLALDKCLPRREFLQVLDIKCGQKHPYQNASVDSTPSRKDDLTIPIKDQCLYNKYDNGGNIQLYHDLEWLTVLRLTDHLQKVTPHSVYMPGPGGSEPYQFTPSEANLRETLRLMNNDLCIKRDLFTHTAPAYDPVVDAFAIQNIETVRQPEPVLNPYTDDLCKKLKISEPIALMMKQGKHPHKRMSVTVTPKRQPSAAEMDVTLDINSRDDAPGSDDETGYVSSGDTGADIIFEVSISSDSDGTSKGMLSPAITPIRSKSTFGARKALLLSTPSHSSVVRSPTSSSSSPSLPDSPLVKPSTGPHHSISSFSSDSPSSKLSNESPTPASPIIVCSSEESCVQQVEDSSQKSLSSTFLSSSSSPTGDDQEELEQPNAEERSSRVSMKLSSPIHEIKREENHNLSSGEDDHLLASVAFLPADRTDAFLNGNSQPAGSGTRTTPSPKRLLEDDCEGEVQGCPPKPSENSSVASEDPSASLAPKPSKIRRRNAAVYTATSEN